MKDIYQSEIWAHLQEEIPSRGKSWLIDVGHEKIVIVRQKLPKGLCWLSCARGPFKKSDLEELLKKIEKIAREEDAIFLRIDPPTELNLNKNDWKKLGFKKAHTTHQPRTTLILNLELSGDEILKQMKPKGRYNIRVAKKHGVKISFGNSTQKNINDFYSLLEKTTERDKFSAHSKKYYETIIKGLEEKNEGGLFLASLKGKVVAGAVVSFPKDADAATYLYGASDHGARQAMAPYLLQWEALCEAKRRGFKFYDFLGISSEKWKGVTEFKKKFGGQEISYPQSQEKIYKPFWFLLMRVAKILFGMR